MEKKRISNYALCIIYYALILLLAGCSDKPQHTFTNELLLPMTPIKDQGKTELCWAYAMLATIETEHLLRGDSVNLSPQYLGRMLKRENQRAMGQTALNLMARYGVVGYDVMPDDATDDLPTPKNVFLLGARYTPLEFAHSVCAPDEYIGLTSIPDSPYYKKIVVPVPDNWEKNRLLECRTCDGHRRTGARRGWATLLYPKKLVGHQRSPQWIGLHVRLQIMARHDCPLYDKRSLLQRVGFLLFS